MLAADDDGGEAALTALHRHSGMAWRVPLAPPPPPPPLPGSPWARGGAARLYGISGLAPVDPTRNPVGDTCCRVAVGVATTCPRHLLASSSTTP